MTFKGGNAFSTFFVWLGIGFLLGLTGSVIAAPCYTLPIDNEAKLVYASGLQPMSQPAVQNPETNNSQVGLKDEELFLKKGCTQCHEISFYGIAGGVTGPDLTKAYNDVPSRFGKTLDEFLWEPEGTMAEMFARMDITDEEKTLVSDLLTKAADVTVEKDTENSTTQ